MTARRKATDARAGVAAKKKRRGALAPAAGAKSALWIIRASFGAGAYWSGNVLCQWVVEQAPHLLDQANPAAPLPSWIASRLAAAPLGLSLEGMPVFAGFASLASMAAYIYAHKPDKGAIDLSQVHGSQRFSTIEERSAYAHTEDTEEWPKPSWCEHILDDNLILSENSMVSASKIPDFTREAQVPNRHVYLMAGSGAGKTFRWVRSQVLQLLGSYVFTDPKGELFKTFASFLERHGYEVVVLNFRDESHMAVSCCYNPLLYCDDMTAIANVVEMFLNNTKGENSSGDQMFFINMERNFYVAVIGLFVFWFKNTGLAVNDCNLPGLIDYLIMAKADGPGGISELDLCFEGTIEKDGMSGFRQFMYDLYSSPEKGYRKPGETDEQLRARVDADITLPENAVLKAYNLFKSAAGDPETMANVVSSCAARLQIFNNPAVRRLLSTDELDLDSMGKRKRALFLCTKDDKGAYDFISAMVLNQLFGRNIDIADASPSGHVDIPIWCILDELANIGKIPNLEKLVATVRSRWINLVSIVQDGKQLEAVYGKQAGSIRSNSAIFEYLGSSLFSDCEEISKEMGSTTRIATSYSRNIAGTGGGGVTEQKQAYQVPLMRPEELYNFNEDGVGLAPDMCLTHYKQGMWFLDRKPDPFRHPRNGELEDTDYFAWNRRRMAAAIQRSTDPATAPVAEGRVEHVLDPEAAEIVRMNLARAELASEVMEGLI
ncbi:MAG: type IV secretory system conjugative DNA transfer family protein [Collinsella sp.]|nr:type IV secretory system conjugative DNA transfer family protein [Collinsella sp.]